MGDETVTKNAVSSRPMTGVADWYRAGGWLSPEKVADEVVATVSVQLPIQRRLAWKSLMAGAHPPGCPT